MQLFLLKPQDAPLYWEQLEPLLKIMGKMSRGRYETADLQELIASGRCHLLVVIENSQVIGGLAASLIEYPRNRELSVVGLVGNKAFEWGEEMLGALEQMAQQMGCAKIVFEGRAEWANVLNPSGYVPVFIGYEKVLECNSIPASTAGQTARIAS